MNKGKLILAVALNVVFVVLILFEYVQLTEENISLSHQLEKRKNENRKTQQNKQEFLLDLRRIAMPIEQRNLSAEDKIFESVKFVHTNSIHLADGERQRYYGSGLEKSLPEVIRKMLQAEQGKDSEKPHITCGLRCFAVRAILREMGIVSRLVQVFTDSQGKPEGHRILEVYNSERRTWEVWDPDFGVTYVDMVTRTPVNIIDLVFSDLGKIIPRGIKAEGWEETGTAHLRDEYFKAVHFESYVLGRGMIGSVIIVNRDRFDLDKVFAGGLTFEEYAMKHFEHPRIIVMDASRSQISGLPHG